MSRCSPAHDADHRRQRAWQRYGIDLTIELDRLCARRLAAGDGVPLLHDRHGDLMALRIRGQWTLLWWDKKKGVIRTFLPSDAGAWVRVNGVRRSSAALLAAGIATWRSWWTPAARAHLAALAGVHRRVAEELGAEVARAILRTAALKEKLRRERR